MQLTIVTACSRLDNLPILYKSIFKDIPEDFDVKRVEKSLWEKIKQKAEEGRRTGIGITAEGDMLAALGLRYGTDDATDFAEQVHKTLAIEAYRASMEMAKQRGPFKVFNPEKESNNPFLLRIKDSDENLYNDIMTYGRRNISMLTIAPTGSTSLMSQTTSGIEPLFMPVYKRRRKVNPNDSSANVTFVDEVGDSWEEYRVFHHKFTMWLEKNGYDAEKVKIVPQDELDEIVKKSPYYKASTSDVDWMSKVTMQGKIQKWVDHSISVTINLPENATKDLVGDLYVKAWEVGCKGVTVYREGSRSGVLISDKKSSKKNVENSSNGELPYIPPQRPLELDADVVRFQNNREQWVAFVGLLDGYPYEIFTGKIDEDVLPVPKSVVRGKIIKNKYQGNTSYDFQYIDKHGYSVTFQGLSRMFDKEYWNYAKLISGVLRHRMPIESVVNLVSSMSIDGETINTWKNGVERALKKYIPDGTKVSSGQKCPECGSTNLMYQEGCLTCPDCGASRCG